MENPPTTFSSCLNKDLTKRSIFDQITVPWIDWITLTLLHPCSPSNSTNSTWHNRFSFHYSIENFSIKSFEFLIRFRGHVDFYPNQGRAPQPGCETLDIFTVTACSHYRATVYFSESILIPQSFRAYQCDLSLIQLPSYRNCLNGSTVALMGEHVDRKYVFLSVLIYIKTTSEFNF